MRMRESNSPSAEMRVSSFSLGSFKQPEFDKSPSVFIKHSALDLRFFRQKFDKRSERNSNKTGSGTQNPKFAVGNKIYHTGVLPLFRYLRKAALFQIRTGRRFRRIQIAFFFRKALNLLVPNCLFERSCQTAVSAVGARLTGQPLFPHCRDRRLVFSPKKSSSKNGRGAYFACRRTSSPYKRRQVFQRFCRSAPERGFESSFLVEI